MCITLLAEIDSSFSNACCGYMREMKDEARNNMSTRDVGVGGTQAKLTFKFWRLCCNPAFIFAYFAVSRLRCLLQMCCAYCAKLAADVLCILCKCKNMKSFAYRSTTSGHFLTLPPAIYTTAFTPTHSPQNKLQVLLCVLQICRK